MRAPVYTLWLLKSAPADMLPTVALRPDCGAAPLHEAGGVVRCGDRR
jgi:hypothetical protein